MVEGPVADPLEDRVEHTTKGHIERRVKGSFERSFEGPVKRSVKHPVEGPVEGSVENSGTSVDDTSIKCNLYGSSQCGVQGSVEICIQTPKPSSKPTLSKPPSKVTANVTSNNTMLSVEVSLIDYDQSKGTIGHTKTYQRVYEYRVLC